MKKISSYIIIILFLNSLVFGLIIDNEINFSSASNGTSRSQVPQIIGTIPNIELTEDSPSFSLNLTTYEYDDKDTGTDLNWYLTDNNLSLYRIIGENSSNDVIFITPMPNQYGNNLVTVWLVDSDGLKANQILWINITPIDDPPTIDYIPGLVLHYDNPFTFDLEFYLDDIDTPMHELIVTAYDGFDENYTTIDGLRVTFNHPQTLLGEIIYVTIMVSDGANIVQDIISIQITDNFPPELIMRLPDVNLAEGSTLHNLFDLDDYFYDRDSDLYYSYSETKYVGILINSDNTVDFSSSRGWAGTEHVVFRAIDSEGALVEDVIMVNVSPVNCYPFLWEIPDLMIQYDHDYRFDLTPYMSECDEIKNLTISVSDPEHVRLNADNNFVIIINYPREYIDQSLEVQFTLSNGIDYDFQNVTITILDDPCPYPNTKPLPDIVLKEDEKLVGSFDLDHYFFDFKEEPIYSITGNKSINVTIHPNHTVDFSAPNDWYGEEEVHFQVINSTGTIAEDVIVVTVLPMNDPPGPVHIVKPKEDAEFDMNDIIVFEGFCHDPDLIYGDNLTFKWFSSIVGKIGVGNTMENNSLPAGKHVITLEVMDRSGLKSNTTTEITVIDNSEPQESKSDYYDILIFTGIGIVIVIFILMFVLLIKIKKNK